MSLDKVIGYCVFFYIAGALTGSYVWSKIVKNLK